MCKIDHALRVLQVNIMTCSIYYVLREMQVIILTCRIGPVLRIPHPVLFLTVGGSTDTLETFLNDQGRTSTGSWLFALLSLDIEQMFRLIVSIRMKMPSNTNLVASRHAQREKGPVPVDVRRSKTSLWRVELSPCSERTIFSSTLFKTSTTKNKRYPYGGQYGEAPPVKCTFFRFHQHKR